MAGSSKPNDLADQSPGSSSASSQNESGGSSADSGNQSASSMTMTNAFKLMERLISANVDQEASGSSSGSMESGGTISGVMPALEDEDWVEEGNEEDSDEEPSPETRRARFLKRTLSANRTATAASSEAKQDESSGEQPLKR